MIIKKSQVLLPLALITASVRAQQVCSHDASADRSGTTFVIRRDTVELPVGFFLLVRKANAIGAIRLTSAAPDASNEWFGSSSYESLFQQDPASSFSSPSVVRRASRMTFSEPIGMHATFSFGGGHHQAKIGPWKFDFYNPTTMPMTDLKFWSGEMSDHGLEFAPTSACNVAEIDPHDQRLHWYRFDQNAQYKLPVAELPHRDIRPTER